MAGAAYLLLPVTGVIAYFVAKDARTRFHGLQAVAIGFAWPVLLYGASFVSAVITQVVFALGTLVWLVFLVGALIGRDPKIPGMWRALRRLAVAAAEEDVATGAR
ncbi:MAG: hypothetical protein ACRDKT_17440 [Actinomycetota bacterium]